MYRIEARSWFSRIRGSTYHSVRLYIWSENLKDFVLMGYIPFRYGYGEAYYITDVADLLGISEYALMDMIKANPQNYVVTCSVVLRKKDL